MNDLYCFDPKSNAWTMVTPATGDAPPKRSYHAACAAVQNDKQYMYLFGGCGEEGQGRLNDLWRWDVQARTWEQLPTHEQITGRGGACLAASPGEPSPLPQLQQAHFCICVLLRTASLFLLPKDVSSTKEWLAWLTSLTSSPTPPQ